MRSGWLHLGLRASAAPLSVELVIQKNMAVGTLVADLCGRTGDKGVDDGWLGPIVLERTRSE